MKQSKELTQFYREYLKWVDSGASRNLPFDPGFGLCANLYEHLVDTTIYPEVLGEMTMQFSDAGLNDIHPFNDDILTYISDREAATHHLNPKRIQWVRDHINT